MDRFRLAARAYLVYGVVYWLGGFYLATQGVGVRGGRMMQAGVVWIVLGLVFCSTGFAPAMTRLRIQAIKRPTGSRWTRKCWCSTTWARIA